MAEHPDDRTVRGHPSAEAVNLDGQSFRITVCANCESVHSVLFLSNDRWYCRNCKATGDARPTVIPLSRPGRR
jgi:hypothetical protein